MIHLCVTYKDNNEVAVTYCSLKDNSYNNKQILDFVKNSGIMVPIKVSNGNTAYINKNTISLSKVTNLQKNNLLLTVKIDDDDDEYALKSLGISVKESEIENIIKIFPNFYDVFLYDEIMEGK